MLDELVQFLLDEIAMDGEAGCQLSRLDHFIKLFYERRSETRARQRSSSSPNVPEQNVDERFKAFVWQSLAGLKQITIGVVEKVGGGGPAGPGGVGSQREGSEATSTNGTPTPAPVRNDSPSTSAVAANAEFATPVPTSDQSAQSTPAAEAGHKVGGLPKQKRSRASTASEGAAHLGRHTPFSTFARSNPSTALLSTNEDYRIRVLIKDEVLGEGREGLVRKYGDALRITVEKQSIWRSITGSHETPNRLTNNVYEILQSISRGREDGKTLIELGQEFRHDQKSLFHFVKALVELKLVVKFKAGVRKFATNRCIHRRYLETSAHWRTYRQSDPDPQVMKSLKDEEGEVDGNEVEEVGAEVTNVMTPIRGDHLWANERLVRSRVERVVRDSPLGIIPHTDIITAIGFRDPGQRERRKLNRIIDDMCTTGLLEKVSLAHVRGMTSCIKYLGTMAVKDDEDGEKMVDVENVPDSGEVYDELPSVPALASSTLESQMLDLLIDAGPDGLLASDLSRMIGGVYVRNIDQCLLRMERQITPVNLGDLTITSVMETFGRKKRTRYFTSVGYEDRLRRDGIEVSSSGKAIAPGDEDRVGGFSKLDNGGYFREFGDLAGYSEGIKLSHATNASVAKRRGRPPRAAGAPVKIGRPKKQPGDAKSPYVRKQPLPPQSRKRSATKSADGPDGEVQTPLAGRTAKKGKRKGKGGKGSGAEGENVGTTPVGANEDSSNVAGEVLVKAPKPRGRPRKKPKLDESVEGTSEALKDGGATLGEAIGDSSATAAAQVVPPPKRKGRPPKRPRTSETNASGDAETRAEQAGPSPNLAGDVLPSNADTSLKLAEDHTASAALQDTPRRSARPRKAPKASDSEATAAAGLGEDAEGVEGGDLSKGPLADTAPEPTTQRKGRVRKRPLSGPPGAMTTSEGAVEDAAMATEGAGNLASLDGKSDTPHIAIAAPSEPIGRPEKMPRTDEPDDTPGPPAHISDAEQEAPRRSSRKRRRVAGSPHAAGAPALAASGDTPTAEHLGVPPKRQRRRRTSETNFGEVKGKKIPGLDPAAGSSLEQSAGHPADGVPEMTALTPFSASLGNQAISRQLPSTAGTEEQNGSTEAEVVHPPAEVVREDHIAPAEVATSAALGEESARDTEAKVATPSVTASQTANIYKARPRAIGKDRKNFSQLLRENDFLAMITDMGGIIEFEPTSKNMAKLYNNYLDTKDAQNRKIGDVDARTANATILGLQNRGLLNRTTIQIPGLRGSVVRRELAYLSSIALNSPEMTDFLQSLRIRIQSQATTRRKLKRGRKISLSESSNLPSEANDGEALREVLADDLDDASRPPPEVNWGSPEAVRQYFKSQFNIVARKYGFINGPLARSRIFHRSLFEVSQQGKRGLRRNDVIPDGDTCIVTSEVVSRLTLSTLVQIVPVGTPKPALEALLSSEEGRNTTCGDLPPEVYSLFTKRARLRACFESLKSILTTLRLLVPLRDGKESDHDYAVTVDGEVKYYKVEDEDEGKSLSFLLPQAAPVYHFSSDSTEKRLVVVQPLHTAEDVDAYWTTLQDLCRPSTSHKVFETVAAAHFPQAFDGPEKFAKDMLTLSRWRRSYRMSMEQHSYLCQVFREHGNDPAFADSDDVVAVADAALVPIDHARNYFRKLERNKEMGRLEMRKKEVQRRDGRRRVKKPCSTTEEAGQDRMDEPPTRTTITESEARARIAQRAREAVEQRSRDWVAITQRFLSRPGIPRMDMETYETLRMSFMAPSGINASQLEAKLQKWLEEHADREATVNYDHTITHGSSSLSLPTEKPTVPIVRRLKRKSAKQPEVSERRNAISPAPVEGSSEEDQAKRTSSRQLMRKKFTEQEDDFIRDGSVILIARASRLDQDVNWGSAQAAFPGELTRGAWLRRWRIIANRAGEQAYLALLQRQWMEIWKEKGGGDELPDPNPEDPHEFDLKKYIDVLRRTVDKSALRYDAMQVQDEEVMMDLPQDPSDIGQIWEVKDVSPPDSALHALWHSKGSVVVRENLFLNEAFTRLHCTKADEPAEAKAFELELASAAIKSVLATPKPVYNVESATNVLRRFEEGGPPAGFLPQAIKHLHDRQVLVKFHSDSDRRLPGRNYVFSDRFTSSFRDVFGSSDFLTAAFFEKSVESAESAMPIIPEQGELMAFVRHVSQNQADVRIDSSACSDRRDPRNFQSRKADDEDIECAVYVRLTHALGDEGLSGLQHDGVTDTAVIPASTNRRGQATLPASPSHELRLSNSAHCLMRGLWLRERQANLNPADRNLLDVITSALKSAGREGLSPTELLSHPGLRTCGTDLIITMTDTLLSASVPLAFWAGIDQPRIVASEYLPEWSVWAVTPEAARRKPTLRPVRFMPRVWVDVNGNRIDDIWKNSLAVVMSKLYQRPGMTESQLFRECQPLFSSFELHDLLLHLHRRKAIDRRGSAHQAGQPFQAAEGSAWIGWYDWHYNACSDKPWYNLV